MYLDTNYLLRYIFDDIPEQSKMAVEAIRAGASTYAEVIPEVVYVLDKVYRIGRNEIAGAIANMLEDVHVDHADVILGALELYARTGLDYVDLKEKTSDALMKLETATLPLSFLPVQVYFSNHRHSQGLPLCG